MNTGKKAGWTLWLTALAAASCLPAAAQDSGLQALSSAFAQGSQVRFSRPAKTAQLSLPGQDVRLMNADEWQQLAPPDGQTLAWLSQRVPGIDVSSVRLVTAQDAEQVMRMAVDAKATYVDVMTNQAFRGGQLYFLRQDVLDDVDAKFISGTVGIKGKGDDGKPFQMQGFLIGQSRVEMIFDREFGFTEEGRRYRVTNGGRVSAKVLGPGDVSIDGISAFGAPVFCPWAKVQRITKQSAATVRVQTSCGSKDGVGVDPVRAR